MHTVLTGLSFHIDLAYSLTPGAYSHKFSTGVRQSEVTTLWRYTNLFIIIIIINLNHK